MILEKIENTEMEPEKENEGQEIKPDEPMALNEERQTGMGRQSNGMDYQMFDQLTDGFIMADSDSFMRPISMAPGTTEVVHIQTPEKYEEYVYKFPQLPTHSHEQAMWKTLDDFETRAWSSKNKGLQTGFIGLDKAFDGGIFPGFTIIAADSNVGKSGFVTQIITNMIELNPDVYVMDFSLDDPMPDKLARMVACSGKIPINCAKTPGNFSTFPTMLAKRKEVLLDLRSKSDRYIAYDSSFSSFAEDIEEAVQNLLVSFEANGLAHKKIVVCIDNFHDLLLRDRPNLAENDRFNELASFCSDMATQYDIPVICTAEFKKLNGNRRASLDDIRQSVKIKYEAKAVILAYNDVHYNGDQAEVYHVDRNNNKGPIFECNIAKNKFGSYKGTLFYKFYPELVQFEEVTDPQQKLLLTQKAYGSKKK